MAVSVISATDQQCDSNGVPLSGGSVTVYAAGTTTPLTLYPNDDLTGSADNPITLDASGRHDMRYFTAVPYKIVVKSAAGTPVYTRDDIDPGVSIGSGALAIASGGTGGTTEGQARSNLGVPSQTEFDDLATDVSTISSTLSAIVGFPQGRLTLTSATPYLTADVTAATAVYYTPAIGNQIPIYNGTLFVSTTFTELTLSLVSNHLANSLYDIFVINDSGTIRLVTGPAWNTATAGSCSRGSGAGTTELQHVNGIYVNKNSMTGRYGATTLTVDAYEGTYVGSIYMDGTNGQVTCHIAWGQSRKWGVWNAYNRSRIILRAGDSTASWPYSTTTWRASNGASTNKLTTFTGLLEQHIDCELRQRWGTGAAANSLGGVALGVNSTTTVSGYGPDNATNNVSGGANLAIGMQLAARHIAPLAIGINNIQSLEYGSTSGTFYGTEQYMLLSANWWG